MSLDDKLNPNDGSFIDGVDNAIFRFNKKIAEIWQNKTYRKKEDLVKFMYLGGAANFVGYGIIIYPTSYLMALPAANSALKAFYKDFRPTNRLDEEMIAEASGFHRKTSRYLEVIVYNLGVGTTLASIGCLVGGYITGDNDLCSISLKVLTYGLGMFCWTSGNYMSRSDIGNPPPKPKKKPVFERIKERLESLVPQPIPEPVLVNKYSTLDDLT